MAARKQASHIDMNGLQVKNLGPTTDANDAATKTYVDNSGTAARARANHTGTQLASTISDFVAQVRANKITDFAAPTSALGMNGQKITNLGAPTTGTDAATKQYADDGDTAAKARANHTGTQTASTISDFVATVKAVRLNELAVPNGVVSMANWKITNLDTPTQVGDAANKNYVDTGDTAAKARSNHTGTQAASTISDFVATVRAVRLDQMAAPAAAVPMGGQKITGLATPTAGTDAANKDYVDTTVGGLSSGLILKGTVRVAVTKNINVAAPGDVTMDGIVPVAGDKILLVGQTTPAQNGPYIFNGSTSAMTRDPAWDTATKMTLGSFWIVREGFNEDTQAVFTNDAAPTVGTTGLRFIITGKVKNTTTYAAQIANEVGCAAGGSIVVTIPEMSGIMNVSLYTRTTGAPLDMAYTVMDNVITLLPDVAVEAGSLAISALGTSA
jgi:hypothetical protein